MALPPAPNGLPPPPPPPVISPCTGVCMLGEDGLCDGCLRSGDEIAAWGSMSHAERVHWIAQIQPQRAKQRGW